MTVTARWSRSGASAAGAAEAPDEQHEDARDGDPVEDRQPRGAAVGARHQTVHRCEAPDREVEVVRLPPEAVRQPLPVVVRDREGEQELGGGDPEPRPERPVARRERDEQLGEREGEERVGRDGQDVDADEGAHEQAAEAVDVLHREARPAAALRLAAEREPEADDDAEDDVRRDARGARRVPDGRARASRACLHRLLALLPDARSRRSRRRRRRSARDPARVEPVRPVGRRAGSRPSRRRRRRGSSRRTQSPAPSTKSLALPVAVSTRCAPRDAVPLVARPPETTRIAPPAGSATSTGPRTARSPPTETKPGPSRAAAASSTASAFTTPLRSSASPGGRESMPPETTTSGQRPQSVGSTSPSVCGGHVERHLPARARRAARRRARAPATGSRATAPTRDGRG